jgi:DNA-binding transcriptional regulator YhcF (GntR family)
VAASSRSVMDPHRGFRRHRPQGLMVPNPTGRRNVSRARRETQHSPITALRPLERTRLYEDVGERLGAFVRESEMVPGDRFPTERELARSLCVSRTSVRQSFVVLQALGFVEVRHGEGIFLRRARGFGESLTKLLDGSSQMRASHTAAAIWTGSHGAEKGGV